MSQALIQATDAFAVTPSDTVKVETRAGNDITFYNMNNGQFVPVQVRKVYATGTTATNLVRMPINTYSR
jgi:hypothetical protein